MLLVPAIIFAAVVVAIFSFAAAAYAPSSLLSARLRSLGVERLIAPDKPSFRERIDQILDPLSKALPLSPAEVSRTRSWLIQAGLRERQHLVIYVVSRILGAVAFFALIVAVVGFEGADVAGVRRRGLFLGLPGGGRTRRERRTRRADDADRKSDPENPKLVHLPLQV